MRSIALLAATTLSCGGGASSCGSGTGASYTFPVDDPSRPDAVLQSEVGRVRITQDFLDFVRPNLPGVLRSALANTPGLALDSSGALRIPLPRAQLFGIGVASADLEDAEAVLWLDDLERALELRFETPNQARMILRDLRLGLAGRLRGDLLGDYSCPFVGDLGTPPFQHAAVVTLDLVIDPGVGPRPDTPLDVRAQLQNLELSQLDIRVLGSNVYCQEPECTDCAVEILGNCIDPGGPCAECSVACGGIATATVELSEALLDVVRPLLLDALRPAIEGLIEDALRELNGQRAGFEAQLSLQELTGLEFIRGEAIGTLLGAPPGRFPVVDRDGLGMELGLEGGFEGPLGECVGALDPFVPRSGPAPEPRARDSQGRPQHAVASIAASLVNQLLHAAHGSGSLCLQLGTDDVRELTGGGFSLNATVLGLLASNLEALADQRAPVIVELKPRKPGRIALGSGAETGMDDMGNPVRDWLVQLSVDELGVAFHVLIEDRYVRLFEVTTDVFAGLNVVVKPNNDLELALGDIRIDNIQEVFSELIPDADFSMVLPTFLDLALGAFLSEPVTFDVNLTSALSDALGVPIGLRVNELVRDGAMQDFLTVSLTFTSSEAVAFRRGVETLATLAPEADLVEETPDGRRPTGRIRLDVGTGLPHDVQADLEYQLRVDGTMWSVFRPPSPDGTLHVSHALLRAPGSHRVEVRARALGDYRSLDSSPIRLDALVDIHAPTLSVRWVDEGLEVTARDREDENGERLTLQLALDDLPSSLVPLAAGKVILPFGEILGRRLTLMALDGAGHRSAPLVVRVPNAPGDPERPAANPGPSGGCRDVPPGSISTWLLLLLALGLGRGARRART